MPKQIAIEIIQNSFGDDLERAEMAFKRMTKDEMQSEYGNSGETPEEILEGYKKDRANKIAALQWAKQASILNN